MPEYIYRLFCWETHAFEVVVCLSCQPWSFGPQWMFSFLPSEQMYFTMSSSSGLETKGYQFRVPSSFLMTTTRPDKKPAEKTPCMMTSWHGNNVLITGPLWRESTVNQCIPHKWPIIPSFDFFWLLEKAVVQTVAGDLRLYDAHVTSL